MGHPNFCCGEILFNEDGLVTRTIHPVIPPRVEYELTELGHSLGEAFCGVWIWAEEHSDEIERARKSFAGR
jgi:DNA-binding HxlR family transcriptional regulator